MTAGEALPAPDQASGSVTGMPGQPGPGQVGPPQPPAIELPAGTAIDDEGNLVDLDGDGLPDAVDGQSIPPAPSELPSTPVTSDGPGADEAVAVVRAYYDAINGGSYGRAYALWSDGGKASGQSPQQFADGFDDTAEVSVEVMPPGRIEPAAGSRYIEVPVALAATRDDGSVHRYVGAYTLRRAVVDGATAEQRAWRIASADIREVQQ
ncbi:hypothetical protein [Lysobacter sp. F6437]|uniref:hypothetical protein n=1 Tax=Lysobacter sp. F6437 TaxID=3459296 RepID=UPI00403DDA13